MTKLVPIPLDLQLRRAFLEYEREGRIFDLPREHFFHGLPGLDTSVVSNGHRASTPLGPAAGPHDQMLQNIVLCWLGGARIIELKTVQILDELKIPRPCIDAANVTYNVEWSQELRLEQSLREYVSAAIFLEILKASGLLGDDFPGRIADTIFDMSVGYNLEGIRSPRVREWIQGMKNATAMIDELRLTLTGSFRRYRDLLFSPCISDTITLSTFHGCPAEEIEGIVTFLLGEMDVNVCVKMNPTLLGREQIGHLLHDVLGYREIKLADEAFEKDLQFDQAIDLVPRLNSTARARGKFFSLKFSNTLVVRNHREVFRDDLMYMSGPPLHVLTLNLVKKFRERMGAAVPLSFSAGLTANNMANVVAMNFVPVTTCTDLLRPGGYGRLHRYMENLGARMRAVGANTIPEFVVRHGGQGAAAIDATVQKLINSLRRIAAGIESPALRATEAWIAGDVTRCLRAWLADARTGLRATCELVTRDFNRVAGGVPESVAERFAVELAGLQQSLVDNAGLLNTPVLVEQATADPRYRWEQNRATPRKIGSRLWLYDCIACDKCVPLCPNDANFVYEAPAIEIAYDNYELLPGGAFKAIKGGAFKVSRCHQLANYADACNECGNCDVFCPEDGGPQAEKPRFFGSLESYRQYAGRNGFFIEFAEGMKTIQGTISGKPYRLALDASADCARFEDESGAYVLQPSRNVLVSWRAKDDATTTARRLDLLPYLQLKFLLEAISDPRHVHYANVAGLGS
jgi:putative selenate reductase